MGDIFLHPIMSRLKEGRGTVSVIWGLLPALTLMSGKRLVFLLDQRFL
jgi:hypothetical protein